MKRTIIKLLLSIVFFLLLFIGAELIWLIQNYFFVIGGLLSGLLFYVYAMILFSWTSGFIWKRKKELTILNNKLNSKELITCLNYSLIGLIAIPVLILTIGLISR